MLNAVINSQSQIFAKHQANISGSLVRRINAAKANHNSRLLALLEQEQQQLANSVAPRLRNRFWAWLTQSNELSVEEVKGAAGGNIWRAYDPSTGETRYGETESEIIDWIEASR